MEISSETSNSCNESSNNVGKVMQLKKEVIMYKKTNAKLQEELRLKNDTVNALLNQNYHELSQLKSNHDKVVSEIQNIYDTNVRIFNTKFREFKTTIHIHYKNLIVTKKKIYEEIKTSQQELINKLSEKNSILSQQLSELEEKIKSSSNTNDTLNLEIKNLKMNISSLEVKSNGLDELNKSHKTLLENLQDVKNNNLNLSEDLDKKKSQIQKLENKINTLEVDLNSSKKLNQELGNKCTMMATDINSKQSVLDEKTHFINNLVVQKDEISKQNEVLESQNKDLSTKLSKNMSELENLKTNHLNLRHLNGEHENELFTLRETKKRFETELKEYKEMMKSLKTSFDERVQNQMTKYTSEIKQLKEEHLATTTTIINSGTEKMDKILVETNTKLMDCQKKNEDLISHVKNLVDGQHIAFTEVEKLKNLNDKLILKQKSIDLEFASIKDSHQKELNEQIARFEKDKEDAIGKIRRDLNSSEDSHNNLLNKYNQAMETLSMTKSTLSDLNVSNVNLTKQIDNKNKEYESYSIKLNKIKDDYDELLEKYKRVVSQLQTYSEREKSLNMQIMKLKGSNNSSSRRSENQNDSI